MSIGSRPKNEVNVPVSLQIVTDISGLRVLALRNGHFYPKTMPGGDVRGAAMELFAFLLFHKPESVVVTGDRDMLMSVIGGHVGLRDTTSTDVEAFKNALTKVQQNASTKLSEREREPLPSFWLHITRVDHQSFIARPSHDMSR